MFFSHLSTIGPLLMLLHAINSEEFVGGQRFFFSVEGHRLSFTRPAVGFIEGRAPFLSQYGGFRFSSKAFFPFFLHPLSLLSDHVASSI